MKNLLIILIVVVIAVGCGKSFDSNKWNEKGVDWWMTDFREEMLDDLITSDTLIGINKSELYKLLGEAEEETNDSNTYLIKEHYSYDIDPDYIHYLVVKFEDEKVIKVYDKKTK